MNTINDIKTRFSTSDDLFAWLQSEAGGRLTVRTDKMVPHYPYALIHYDKATTDMTAPHAGAFRSVIWNANTNQPACVGPARGLSAEQAKADNIDLTSPGTVVEDFIDGTMINMFYTERGWVVATRTQINAGHHFYGTRPFSDLFWETFFAARLTPAHLNPAHTYSWVLQHPEERIVVAPEYGIPHLFLVDTTDPAPAEELERLRPKRYTTLTTLADLNAHVAAWGRRYGIKWKGLVVKTATGARYKFRTEEYNAAHHLRGNQANRAYTWLERWGEKRLPEYMRMYPEESCAAAAVIDALKAHTQTLYDLYQQVYRLRTLTLGNAPHKYRKLLWDCHAANAGAYFPNTRNFMNRQDTARKLWLINYDKRTATAAK